MGVASSNFCLSSGAGIVGASLTQKEHAAIADQELSAFLVGAAQGDVQAIHAALRRGNVKVDSLMRLDGAWYRARAMADAEALLRNWHKGYPNAGRVLGRTALMLAVMSGSRTAVEALLAAGAEVKFKDARDGYTALHFAAMTDDEPLVRLLIQNGAKLNARSDDGSTPLHRAAICGCMRTMQALMDAGAKLNARTKMDRTPLGSAVRSRQWPACLLLLSRSSAAGGGMEVDVDTVDGADGLTELHHVVTSLCERLLDEPPAEAGELALMTQVVTQLIRAGADILSTSGTGSTPLDAAAQAGMAEIATELEAMARRCGKSVDAEATAHLRQFRAMGSSLGGVSYRGAIASQEISLVENGQHGEEEADTREPTPREAEATPHMTPRPPLQSSHPGPVAESAESLSPEQSLAAAHPQVGSHSLHADSAEYVANEMNVGASHGQVRGVGALVTDVLAQKLGKRWANMGDSRRNSQLSASVSRDRPGASQHSSHAGSHSGHTSSTQVQADGPPMAPFNFGITGSRHQAGRAHQGSAAEFSIPLSGMPGMIRGLGAF